MTTSAPENNNGFVPFVGGCLLALGIALTFIPQMLQSALEYEVPGHAVMTFIGYASLTLSIAIFAVMAARYIARSSRDPAVR